MKIGFIGLGNMGFLMTQNLCAKGYQLNVYDVNLKNCTELVKQYKNAAIADNPGSLTAWSDVIITMLPDSKIVKQVMYGDNGIYPSLEPGKVFIDMSSSVPEVTREIYKTLRQKGVEMLAAPVSGGVGGALKGTLSIMVGGKETVFEKCKQLLLAMGSKITLVGEIGSGHIIKALNNLLSATTIWATAEVLALGVKAGLSPEKMLEVINTSSGRSNSSENKFPKFVLTRKFDFGFSGALTLKDVKIANGIGDEYCVPMLLGSHIEQLWSYGLTVDPTMDQTAIVKIVEKMFNVTIQGETQGDEK